MKFRVFWDVAPFSHVEVDRRFRNMYCLHHQGLPDNAVRTFETSVSFNVTTQRYIPEDSKHHIRRRENLKYHIVIIIIISREKSYCLEDQMSGLLKGKDPGNYI
jgi:hypothetical protein